MEGNGSLEETWQTFWKHRCSCHRERLILHYLPLIERAEAAIRRRLPPADPDDIKSWAYMGLIKSVDRWDPAYGSTFESYALGSIRGISIDEARAADWAPRSVRRKQRAIEKATTELESELGRDPQPDEVADRLGWQKSQVDKAEKETAVAFVKSLDEGMFTGDDGQPFQRYEVVEDEGSTPETTAIVNRATQEAVAFLQSLPARVRAILALKYYEGIKFGEVAEILGLSEAQVGQFHGFAVYEVAQLMAEAVQGDA